MGTFIKTLCHYVFQRYIENYIMKMTKRIIYYPSPNTVLVMLSAENLTNVNNGMYQRTIQYVLLIGVILSLNCDCVYTTKSDSVIMYCTFYNNVLH